jgi:hypothetical protein
MRSTHHAPLAIVAVALALAGCSAQVGTSPSDAGRPAPSAPDLETVPPADEPVTGEVPAEVMAAIVADAAERAEVAADAIEVVQAAAVTWSDGSLGCPEPGMTYTMALVDGYHVILDAGGEELDYRVMAQGGFRLCEDGGGRPSG